MKNSAYGRVKVYRGNDGKVTFLDNQPYRENDPEDLLQPLFRDGKLLREVSLQEIRARIREQDRI